MPKNSNMAVPGFRLGAVSAGIRHEGRLDLGLIMAERPCPAAGIFTRNRIKAPSVILNKRRLRNGLAQAVLVNSGNANACVGPSGMADAMLCTRVLAVATGINPGRVLMSSTGVIGEPLPADRIVKAIPGLAEAARADGLDDFARAIITTDTGPKTAFRKITVSGKKVSIAGAAKGAGMIMPNLATMLAFIITDAELEPAALSGFLAGAAEDSFNALTVDGDTSTSDTVLLLASGASGARVSAQGEGAKKFRAALDDLCLEIARMIAADGEGATKMFMVSVEGAASRAEADRVARKVANSPLVKTAFHAGDPNWGRVMMAVGSAGAAVAPERVEIDFEPASGRPVPVVRAGAIAPGYSEERAATVLSGTDFTVRIRLGRGKHGRTIYTCDLSADYIRINADYRS